MNHPAMIMREATVEERDAQSEWIRVCFPDVAAGARSGAPLYYAVTFD